MQCTLLTTASLLRSHFYLLSPNLVALLPPTLALTYYCYFSHDAIFRHLQSIVTRDDPAVKRGKPAPDIYLEAASRIGVDPSECLVFEDALAGVVAGHAAGCQVVAIPDTRFSEAEKQEFLTKGANVVLETLWDLDGAPLGLPELSMKQAAVTNDRKV